MAGETLGPCRRSDDAIPASQAAATGWMLRPMERMYGDEGIFDQSIGEGAILGLGAGLLPSHGSGNGSWRRFLRPNRPCLRSRRLSRGNVQASRRRTL